jgi:hypothetical protein
VFVNQLRAAGLYPALAAPSFTPHGGTLAYGAEVGVSAGAGTVYVTVDGSDPRVAFSGAVADTAVACGAGVTVTNAGVIKARVLAQGVVERAVRSLVQPDLSRAVCSCRPGTVRGRRDELAGASGAGTGPGRR